MSATRPVMPTAGASSIPPTLDERFALVRERITRAAARSGRSRDDIILVAVTKTAEPEQIRRLIDLGHRHMGANRVQRLIQHAAIADEYVCRLSVLSTARKQQAGEAGRSVGSTPEARPIHWHMIGYLQRNKVRKAAELCRLIHSIDSLRIAEELQQAALRRDQILEVLVQVNCSGEPQKHGCPLAAVIPLIEQIETMVNIRVRGLMTMAPYSENPEDSRPHFSRCREAFEEVRTEGFGEGRFNLLSMGMSGDFEVAISEGANVVRVGTSIFGEPAQATHDADDDESDEG
ncbi:MAG: YggS family pyridoxal phosphate-dependent enzyme [Phycisphaerae bacterium]|nr:YggS family pyridoxal phosphate-dependent enzyme [Phycisphaerae bacterium]